MAKEAGLDSLIRRFLRIQPTNCGRRSLQALQTPKKQGLHKYHPGLVI
jgi:hypothetical protein